MMRAFLTAMLFVMMMPAHAGEFWTSLWHNADQQGELLLQQGDASNAAKVYADPHRKAYAKIQAGDYAGAVKDLARLHGSDADYNRGNALAHAGDLQGALDAYDAALKSDPNNQDAKHNRELLANALKQLPPQQQKPDDKQSQDDKKDGKQDQGQGGQGKDDKQGQSDQDKNKQGDSKASDSSPQDKEGGISQTGKEPDAQSQNGKNPDKKNQDGNRQNGKQASQDKNAQQSQSSQVGMQQPAATKNEGEQARRDAEASLAKPEAGGNAGAGAGEKMNTGKATQTNAPKSEKQIAQEQWLRNIPDDPGGLLRRKFLIEHMMRQQKAQQ